MVYPQLGRAVARLYLLDFLHKVPETSEAILVDRFRGVMSPATISRELDAMVDDRLITSRRAGRERWIVLAEDAKVRARDAALANSAASRVFGVPVSGLEPTVVRLNLSHEKV